MGRMPENMTHQYARFICLWKKTLKGCFAGIRGQEEERAPLHSLSFFQAPKQKFP